MKKLIATIIGAAALTAGTAHAHQPVTVHGCTTDTGQRRIQITAHDTTNPVVGVGLDGRYWQYWAHQTDGPTADIVVTTPTPWVAVFVQRDTDPHAWDFGFHQMHRHGGRWVWMGVPCSRVRWAS